MNSDSPNNVSCDCHFWRSIDRLEDASERLVASGLCEDREAVFVELLKVANSHGYQTYKTVCENNSRSFFSHTERKRIVAEYLKLIKNGANHYDRGRRLQAWGITRAQIAAWARKYLGPCVISRADPPKWPAVYEYVLRHPGSSHRTIVTETGLSGATVWTALSRLIKRQQVHRERTGHEVYRYYVIDAR